MATSRELLAAQKQGAEILHNGAPVRFDPRRPRDPKPWVHQGHRYYSDQCQVYWSPALDDECVDRDGEPWPEHDYGEVECRRCGAEPES